MSLNIEIRDEFKARYILQPNVSQVRRDMGKNAPSRATAARWATDLRAEEDFIAARNLLANEYYDEAAKAAHEVLLLALDNYKETGDASHGRLVIQAYAAFVHAMDHFQNQVQRDEERVPANIIVQGPQETVENVVHAN